jgi:hypothetical protein
MNGLRIIFGVLALGYALLSLMRGEWLTAVEFSALGWGLLLDPREHGTRRLRRRLMFVALVCALLRLIL